MVTMPHPGSSPSIQELLAGVGFPVTKEQLLANFEQNGATETLLSILRDSDKTQFSSPSDVIETLRNR